jgi:hypothetical protein
MNDFLASGQGYSRLQPTHQLRKHVELVATERTIAPKAQAARLSNSSAPARHSLYPKAAQATHARRWGFAPSTTLDAGPQRLASSDEQSCVTAGETALILVSGGNATLLQESATIKSSGVIRGSRQSSKAARHSFPVQTYLQWEKIKRSVVRARRNLSI